jgi:hypothetical protein
MADKKNAIKNLDTAKEHLEKVTKADKQAGRHYETPEYLAANKAVVEAEKHVPWWRR